MPNIRSAKAILMTKSKLLLRNRLLLLKGIMVNKFPITIKTDATEKNTAPYHAFCFRKRTSSQMDYSFSGNICRRCVFHRRHFSAEKFETSDALVNLKEDILNCYI